MILAYTFEKYDASGNVYIYEVGFPASCAYLLAMDFKSTTLIYVAEQTIAKVDAVNHRSMHRDKALQSLIDLDRSGHPVENACLIRGWGEGWIWPETESYHITGRLPFLFKQERIRHQFDEPFDPLFILPVVITISGERARIVDQMFQSRLLL